MFSDVWSENAALFERLMEIYTNPPIIYYGFKSLVKCVYSSIRHLFCCDITDCSRMPPERERPSQANKAKKIALHSMSQKIALLYSLFYKYVFILVCKIT